MSQSNWNFNIVDVGTFNYTISDSTEPPLNDAGGKCPFVETKDGNCFPHTSGGVLLNLQVCQSVSRFFTTAPENFYIWVKRRFLDGLPLAAIFAFSQKTSLAISVT